MQGENERQQEPIKWAPGGSEKKVNDNTYYISSTKRVTKKFLEVSRYSRELVVQSNGKEMYKKVCCTCTCKVAFFAN